MLVQNVEPDLHCKYGAAILSKAALNFLLFYFTCSPVCQEVLRATFLLNHAENKSHRQRNHWISKPNYCICKEKIQICAFRH